MVIHLTASTKLIGSWLKATLTPSSESGGIGSTVMSTTLSSEPQSVRLVGKASTTDPTNVPTTPETPLSPSTECEELVRFKALPEETQEAILDKHRDWNTDGSYDWWDDVYADFIRRMDEIGIEVSTVPVGTVRGTHEHPAVFFSGFGSQGDGACFEGRVDDWTTFFQALYPTEFDKYQPLWEKSESGSPALSWTHNSRYYHYNSCTFHSDFDINNGFDADTQPLRHAAAEVIVDELTDLCEAMLYDAEEFIKDKMKDLYTQLEEEYDHLTSDEAVLDSLIANDMLKEIVDEHEA